MDILSENGQKSVADEQRAYLMFSARYPKLEIIETPKEEPALIDAVLSFNGEMIACIETKCRDLDLHTLQTQFNNEWLVTFDKVESIRELSRSLRVKSFGLLYLKKSDTLLIQHLTDHQGQLVPRVRVATTRTQATCNGGSAVRKNSFIDMTNAKVISGSSLADFSRQLH